MITLMEITNDRVHQSTWILFVMIVAQHSCIHIMYNKDANMLYIYLNIDQQIRGLEQQMSYSWFLKILRRENEFWGQL